MAKRNWEERLALVSRGQRERRHAKLQHARAVPYDGNDIYAGLGPLRQPLRATRTPIPLRDPHDIIDFSELFKEQKKKRLAEEESQAIRKSIQEEEARQRMQEQREAEQEKERQAERAKQRHLQRDTEEAEEERMEEEEEAQRSQSEEEAQNKQQEEEVQRKQQEEEAQRKQQEEEVPRKPRTKERAHRYDDKDERRKKFKNDAPAWERRQPPPPPPQVKRKYKFKPGTVALKEIRKYQRSSDLLIPKAPFARVVREVVDEVSDTVTRVQSDAILALQEATEDILVSIFNDSVLCHVHRQRVTLMPKDWALALCLRGEDCVQKDH